MISYVVSLFSRIVQSLIPTLPTTAMDQLTPSNEPAEHNERELLFPYFAGYSFSNVVAYKLRQTLVGKPIPSSEDMRNLIDNHHVRQLYPHQSEIRDSLRKYLESKGQTFHVFVAFAGGLPFDYIIATKGGDHPKDPPPEATEGEKEAIVRGWLEMNGITPKEYQWMVRFDARINFD